MNCTTVILYAFIQFQSPASLLIAVWIQQSRSTGHDNVYGNVSPLRFSDLLGSGWEQVYDQFSTRSLKMMVFLIRNVCLYGMAVDLDTRIEV